MNFPDFIIIGAAKAGTTSLFYYLNRHPEIKMAGENGLRFFTQDKENHERSEQYKTLFAGKKGAKLFGESTPAYTRFPQVPEVSRRIHQCIPHVKLIYLVRDPIERVVSHYIQNYAANLENRSFHETMRTSQDNVYLDSSRYALQLEQYLRYFPQEKILIIEQKELLTQPSAALGKIFNFLGVNPALYPNHIVETRHASEGKRRKNEFGARLSASSFMRWVPKLPSSIRWHVENIIYYPFSSPVRKPDLKNGMREKLIQYLQDDTRRFRQMTGQSFESWSL